MSIRRVRAAAQILLALVILSALVTQFVHGLRNAPDILVYAESFLSYFTILSNIFVAGLFLVEAKRVHQGKPESARLSFLRGAAVFFMLATGITYALFLRGPAGHAGFDQSAYSIAWVNSVFHYLVPGVVALDWLLFPPPRRIRWAALPLWIGITAVYAVFVEAGGFFTRAYPYFFFDPARFNGYAGVLRGVTGFIPFFLVFATLVIASNNIGHYFRSRRNRT
jgi:hypothetical protein